MNPSATDFAPLNIVRVLVVVPPLVRREAYAADDGRPDFESYRLISPVEPLTAAAVLRARGYQPAFFDLGSFAEDPYPGLEALLAEFRPDAVALLQSVLTFATSHDWDGAEVFARVRAAVLGAITVLTGGHASNYPGQAVAAGSCDYSLRGEPEFALAELFDRLNDGAPLDDLAGLSRRAADGALLNHAASPAVDVAALPVPAYDLLDDAALSRYASRLEQGKIRYPEKSRAYRDIMTSRGCVLRCSFCSVAHLRGEKQRYRRKPVALVLDEIRQALDQGVGEIHFFDDLFVEDEAQIIALMNGIVQAGLEFPWFVAQGMPLWPLTREALAAMHAAGMYRLICPFESGSDRLLKRVIGKLASVEHNHEVVGWAAALGLEMIGMYVVGMPGETRQELIATLDFAESHPAVDYHVFSIATPMVGTRMTRQLMRDQKLGAVQLEQANKVVKRTVALFRGGEVTELELGLVRSHDWNRINFQTPARREKYARMVGVSLAELDQMRAHSIATFEQFFPDYEGPRGLRELLASDFDPRTRVPLLPA